jgi:hypothetical protein
VAHGRPGPVIAAALLGAGGALAYTHHAEPTAAPVAAPSAAPVIPGPEATDSRPRSDVTKAAWTKVITTLQGGKPDTARVAASEVDGSDYFGGVASVGLFDTLMPGDITLDLLCLGHGTVTVWVRDAGGTQAPVDAPTSLVCYRFDRATVTASIHGAGFFVYVSPEPHTAVVLGYVASMSS